MKSYSIDELFERNLLMLIPFYIFTHEKNFKDYESNKVRLDEFKKEYQKIADRLENLAKEEIIGEFDRRVIVRLCDEVAKAIAAKYEHVMQGLDDIMGGPLLKIDARKYHDEGKIEGRKEGKITSLIESVKNLIANTGWSLDKALNALSVSPEDRKILLPLLNEQ